MDTKQIRARARENLQQTWLLSIGVAAVAVLLGGLIQGSPFLPDYKVEIPIPFLQEMNQALYNGISVGRLNFSVQSGVIGLLAFLVGGTVQLGHARFLLNQHDGKPIQFGDLFSQFHRFGQGFAQHFLRTLFTTLWSLLFIIPGIMASYSYAMTPFLMAEDETLTASQAINISKEIMDGHKADLFFLDLTFFGWSLLSGLVWNLGYLVLNPYTSAARAVFYRQLTGKTALPEVQ